MLSNKHDPCNAAVEIGNVWWLFVWFSVELLPLMFVVYVKQVREHPMYMLIKARILKKQGDLQECINCLKAAMALPGVRTGGGK